MSRGSDKLVPGRQRTMDSEPVLVTKLHKPGVQPGWIQRPRLLKAVNSGLRSRLMLISAPPGSGKTTLLAQWMSHTDKNVAWLSLDERDNYLPRFFAHLDAAIRIATGDDSLPQLPVSEQLAFQENAIMHLTRLINRIASDPDILVVILDDYHEIADQAVHETLGFLLKNQPENMRLILSSRHDPPWALARMKAQMEMAEIRGESLQLTLPEVKSFLRHCMRLRLQEQDISTLKRYTEGWLAGVQMIALALHGQQDTTAYLHNLTDTPNRLVIDYLLEEVLAHQSGEIREFLCKTLVVDTFNAALCNRICALEDSTPLLDYLKRSNLFLMPIEAEDCWYRYHPLFCQALRAHLAATRPETLLETHRRAGAWYEEQGFLIDAVKHAFAAGDLKRVIRLFEMNVLAVAHVGEVGIIKGWLHQVLAESKSASRWLDLAVAWMELFSGRWDASQSHLSRVIEAPADKDKISEQEHLRLGGHVELLRSYREHQQYQDEQADRLARHALELLPDEDWWARGLALAMLGQVNIRQGALDQAEAHITRAGAVGKTTGENVIAIIALCDLAHVQYLRGELHDSADICQIVLDLAEEYEATRGRPLLIAGRAHSLLSVILFEWNEKDKALDHAAEGLKQCQQWGQVEPLLFSYRCMLDVTEYNIKERADVFTWYRTHAESTGLDAFNLTAFEADIHRASGEIDKAYSVIRESGYDLYHPITLNECDSALKMARIILDSGNTDEAIQWLLPIIELAKRLGADRYYLAGLIQLAAAHKGRGEEDKAQAVIRHALAASRPERYIRSYLAHGSPMTELLEWALAENVEPAYTSGLLAALDPPPAPDNTGSDGTALLSEGIEPLSSREMEVLNLLATHMTGPEIANELIVSVTTFRTHVQNIYSKMNVNTRSDAVSRAVELGWLHVP